MGAESMLRRAAAATLQQIASDRGLSGDQLGDRLVPTAGLGPGGTWVSWLMNLAAPME